MPGASLRASSTRTLSRYLQNITGKRCKKTSLFSPFQKIQTNRVKSGRFLHRLVRSCGCLGLASGQVLHGHLHDTYRITLKISHLNRWQYSKRFRRHGHRGRLLYCVSFSGVTYCNMNPESCFSNFRDSFYLFTPLLRSDGLGRARQASPELSRLSGQRHIGFYNSLIHR